MQIQIQTTPLEVDDIILDSITQKLGKLVKIYERIESCKVILKKEKSDRKKNFIIEVRLAVPKEDLFAVEGAESFGRALDRVIADLKKQLIRRKEKMNETQSVTEVVPNVEL